MPYLHIPFSLLGHGSVFTIFSPAFYCACFLLTLKLSGHCLATGGTERQVESSRRAMPRLNENDRLRAIGMIQAGMLHRAVATQFGVHINTIQALWRRFQQFGNVRD